MTFGTCGPLVHLDIWTWSLGHGPFGHGPPSDPPVLGTWPSDTVSSDMVLGHRVFGHHPRTFPLPHPSHSPSTHTSRYGVCLVSVII
ncbi:hypothetical protein MT418_008378 [Batrachochytrium dendrobatidis]